MDDKELRLQELNAQGRVLFSCDKYEEAIAKYNEAIEEEPMYLPTYFNICEAYIMADKYEEAKKMMKRVLLVDKAQGEAYFHLGNIALLQSDYEEGKLQYAKAINNNYDASQIYLNLASVSEEQDEWEQALSYYTKAIARDKLCHNAKIRKIEIYMMLNKVPEALDSADDLIETNPEIFEGHHLKFVVLATDSKLKEAEEVLDKAQSLFPDDQGFVLDRVKLYELKKEYTQALELLETIKGDNVPQEVLAIEKAKLYLMLGNVEEARILLKSCNDNEMISEIEKMLILISMDEKDYDGMRHSAERIIALEKYDSNYFTALYFKAYALKMSENKVEAEKAYKEAAKIMQQACSVNSGVLDLYIYRAICHRELKEYDRANEMLDYVLLVSEDIAEAYYIRYLIYSDLNDDRAQGELDKAKSLDPAVAALFGE